MTDTLINETADAWNMSVKQVKSIVRWVNSHIEPYNRAIVFSTLLRKAHEKQYDLSYKAKNVQSKLF